MWLKASAVEFLEEANGYLDTLTRTLAAWELRRLLSGRFDRGAAVLSVQAGVGGDDAMDWAGMLARMYTQWFAAKGWDVVCVDRSPGELAGVKSVDFEVHGAYAYGLLSAEKGTHRLIRQSPFNSKGMRQTSFAAVDVVPLIDEARTRWSACS